MERVKIAERLREIASYIEMDPPEEEGVRREFMEHLKKDFMQFVRNDPRFKHENPEKLWKNFEEDVSVDLKKIRS
jgi:CRISPR/Cas system-associated protein Csm6